MAKGLGDSRRVGWTVGSMLLSAAVASAATDLSVLVAPAGVSLLSVSAWWLLVFGFYGAATGSFCGVLMERLPAGDSPHGRSHCVCGRQLLWWENVPVVSWLLLQGRARCCDARIPVWYFAVEVSYAVWGMLWVLLPVGLVWAVVFSVVGWFSVAAGVVLYRR